MTALLRNVADVLMAVWPPTTGEHEVVALGRTGSAADGFVDCLTTHLGNVSSSIDLFLVEFAITGAADLKLAGKVQA